MRGGGSEIDVPLDYGDYYFLEALVRFAKAKGLLPQGALMDRK